MGRSTTYVGGVGLFLYSYSTSVDGTTFLLRVLFIGGKLVTKRRAFFRSKGGRGQGFGPFHQVGDRGRGNVVVLVVEVCVNGGHGVLGGVKGLGVNVLFLVFCGR